MNLSEIEQFRLSDAIKFHDSLNPKLWLDDHLDPRVRTQLLEIAEDFMEHLGVRKNIDVVDITISGSNAAYTYTPHSDIDLHILVNMDKLSNDNVYRELFTSKKLEYNSSHNIKVRGYDVELYVQDSSQPVKSLGEYSILNDRWIKFPTKHKSNFDERAARVKFMKLVQLSELALRTDDLGKLDELLKTIKRYRGAGLSEHGEFGPENLAYKALRSRGIIQQLYDKRDELHSRELSLDEVTQNRRTRDPLADKLSKELAKYKITDEDYDPNGPPPGPEFKPTMPAGTVRVDVSDVYDWYKLGQHISNMKGLGKHDFGKGPPSTILSFGDEDTEHKYIKDLEKTGLKTTDIDPVDPKQPKGMRRQKVDPTYNVGVTESFENPYSLKWTKVDNIKEGSKQFNKCFDKACQLYDKALEKDLNPILYQVADYQGSAENADDKWLKLPKHVWSHYVTVIGNTVYDPTATQFGPEKETKYSLDKLKTEWGQIYKIRPRELGESASGYIPSNAEKNDPRFKTALTVDVHPDSIQKNAAKLGLGKIKRSGIPPTAKSNGKIS